MRKDIDVIVDTDPVRARNVLLESHPGFTIARNKLMFIHEGTEIVVELLRGGATQQLRLPDARSVQIHQVSARELPGRVGDIPSQ